MFLRSVSAAVLCWLFACSVFSAGEIKTDSYFYTEDGSLRLYTASDEQTAVLSENNTSSLVQAAGEIFSRNEYDNLMRLRSRTVWRSSGSASAAQIVSRTEYLYGGDSFRFSSSETYDSAKSTVAITFFSDAGLPVRETVYALVSGAESASRPAASAASAEVKRILRSATEYRYTKDEKLTEKIYTDYTAENPAVYRTVYQKAGDIRGGYDYFENGKLRISRKYANEDSYTETVYFDSGQRIETIYRNGKPEEEIFFTGGTETRRNTF